jgi:hypothetical protein
MSVTTTVGVDRLGGGHQFVVVGRHRIEGFQVLALDVAHKGGRTFGFRIEDGRSSVAYLPDHRLPDGGRVLNGARPWTAAALIWITCDGLSAASTCSSTTPVH